MFLDEEKKNFLKCYGVYLSLSFQNLQKISGKISLTLSSDDKRVDPVVRTIVFHAKT